MEPAEIAAIVAAVQQAMPAAAMMNYHIFQTIRKYDGTYPALEWVTEFNSDRTTYNLNDEWAIRNIDRFLTGSAQSWFIPLKTSYHAALTLNPPQETHAQIWTRLSQALTTFFDSSSVKERAKAANLQIRFSMTDNPLDYVTKKIAILHQMDPRMTAEDQVRNLIQGIPVEFRPHMAAGGVSTPDDFTKRLSALALVSNRSRPKSNSSQATSNQNSTLQQHSTNSYSQATQVNQARVANRNQAPRNSAQQQNRNSAQNSRPPNRAERKCGFCERNYPHRNCTNHNEEDCFQKADDEGRPRPYRNPSLFPNGVYFNPRAPPNNNAPRVNSLQVAEPQSQDPSLN